MLELFLAELNKFVQEHPACNPSVSSRYASPGQLSEIPHRYVRVLCGCHSVPGRKLREGQFPRG